MNLHIRSEQNFVELTCLRHGKARQCTTLIWELMLPEDQEGDIIVRNLLLKPRQKKIDYSIGDIQNDD